MITFGRFLDFMMHHNLSPITYLVSHCLNNINNVIITFINIFTELEK